MENWKIALPKSEFSKQKGDERLHALLNLARAMNALRFGHVAYLQAREDESPAGTRQRLNAFLFNCATMHETFSVVDRLGMHFKELQSFNQGIAALQRDKRFRRFREKVLPRLRKKFVFHFDPDVAPEVLENLDLPVYVFVAGRGRKSGDTYFNLADAVAVNYLIEGLEEYGSTEYQKLEAIVKDATDLTVALMDAGEALISEALHEMGWRLEGPPNGI